MIDQKKNKVHIDPEQMDIDLKSAESDRKLINEPVRMGTTDFTEYEGGEPCLGQDTASSALGKSEKSHKDCTRPITRNLQLSVR